MKSETELLSREIVAVVQAFRWDTAKSISLVEDMLKFHESKNSRDVRTSQERAENEPESVPVRRTRRRRKGKWWKPHEVRLLKRGLREGRSAAQIARELKISSQRVRTRISYMRRNGDLTR